MPTWSGWGESAVRKTASYGGWNPVYAAGGSHPSTGVANTGFTAINSHATSHFLPADGTSTADEAFGQHAAKTRGALEVGQEPSIASAYLGRSVAPTTLHGAGPKKVVVRKGKQRKGRSKTEATCKRQRSGNVASTLSISKAGVSSTMTPDDEALFDFDSDVLSSTDIDTLSAACNAKVSPRCDDATQLHGEDNATRSRETRPLSMYSQPTSMDTVKHQQPQTTMGSLREKTSNDSATCKQWVAKAGPGSRGHVGPLSASATAIQPNTTVLRPRKTIAMSKSSPDETTADATQLPTPANSDPPTATSVHKPVLAKRANSKRISRTKSDEEFAIMNDDDEADLIDLTENVEVLPLPTASDRSRTTRDWKSNMRDVDEHEDYGGALFSQAERELLARLKQVEGSRKPIVRTTFPQQILDRSSLFGASNTAVLRTCFRVGEALNTGCQAVRNNKTVMLELYARVTVSYRDFKPSRKQHFTVKDLYHDNPPHLNGTFELWDQSELWELDSKPFLSAGPAGMMCRMIARMKRDGMKWKLEILSIWQASWDDIEHIAGIYARPMADQS